MKGLYSIILLTISNVFMTLAWYGHLQFKNWSLLQKSGLAGVVLLSWGLAFFEYCFQVPANRIGFKGDGGPFSLFELKVIQEMLSLVVFTLVVTFLFKSEKPAWNHYLAFGLILAAVVVAFKKW